MPPLSPRVYIRRVRPDDAAALERFYVELSADSRVMRFLGSASGLSHGQALSFSSPDHEHREGFVAVLPGADGDEGRIVGHLCLEPDHGTTAEVALAIADEWQRHGLGRRLMRSALGWAREAGVTKLCATMFCTNAGIHRLLLSLGLPAHVRQLTAGVSEITIDLDGPASAAA